WSLEGQWQAIADCDAVIIPSLDNETKNVKGPNRLMEAIRGGRPVAAYPLPSYKAFEEVCWLNPDVAEGLKAMLADPGSVAAKIADGQRLIDRLHGPAVIADQWRRLFQEVGAKPSSPQPAATPTANGALVRLNLGCGDKILPGY